MSQIYGIRRAIVIPLAVSWVSLFVLLLSAWFVTALPGEKSFLMVIFLLVGYLLLEVVSRRASLGNEGVVIRKLLRNKVVGWDEITYLGSLVMGAKVYLLLTTTRGFVILSNNFERFPDLLRHLVENLPAERIGEEVSSVLAKPRQNTGPVYSAWLMAVFMMAIMVLRLFIF
jgi:hypothetical protein